MFVKIKEVEQGEVCLVEMQSDQEYLGFIIIWSYIQKTGLACWKIPQKIQIFRREIVLERENYQFCNGLRKGQQAYSKTKVSWQVLQDRFLVSDLTFHLRMVGNTQ